MTEVCNYVSKHGAIFDQRVRDLWATGLSTASIGEQLGVTKNAICGLARRLDLPQRPSPIRRRGGRNELQAAAQRTASPRGMTPRAPAPPAEPVAANATLPPLASLQEPPSPAPDTQRDPVEDPPQTAAPAMPPVPAILAPPETGLSVITSRTSSRRCCFPLGEPGKSGFRFCDDVITTLKSPYCDEHRKLAFVRVRRSEAVNLVNGAA